MKFISALSFMIRDLQYPVVTGYQIGSIIYKLYVTREYKGSKISYLRRQLPRREDYSRYIKKLREIGILNSTHIAHKEIFGVFSQSRPSAEEIACCIDPFVYISHFSAMEYHGLTDRFPKVLFLSSPKPTVWSNLANKQMQNDLDGYLDEYIDTGLPTLRRLHIDKIMKKTVNKHASLKYTPGSYLNIKGKTIRVSSIGRTFYDMLHNPSLCGGIYHVLDVYEEYAKNYLRLIIDEFDQHGNAIDKVRAGYVLNERLGIVDPRIELWKENVQRGGSRKLVADEPYEPFFSEKWCLSINIAEKQRSG